MKPHDIRCEHGIHKGRFISRKRKQWRENVLASKKKKKVVDTTENCIFSGRRVIELGHRAEELRCKQCDVSLSLRNVEKECNIGPASGLHIKCTACHAQKIAHTVKALDIPTVSKALIKRHERGAGVAIEELAKKSCHTSIRMEKELTIAAERNLLLTPNKAQEIQPIKYKDKTSEIENYLKQQGQFV